MKLKILAYSDLNKAWYCYDLADENPDGTFSVSDKKIVDFQERTGSTPFTIEEGDIIECDSLFPYLELCISPRKVEPENSE